MSTQLIRVANTLCEIFGDKLIITVHERLDVNIV